jgi:hypothetical protein
MGYGDKMGTAYKTAKAPEPATWKRQSRGFFAWVMVAICIESSLQSECDLYHREEVNRGRGRKKFLPLFVGVFSPFPYLVSLLESCRSGRTRFAPT